MSQGRTLLLLHPVLWGITRDQALEALPAERRDGAQTVSIEVPWSSDGRPPDWSALRQHQERLFFEKVRPHLTQHPDDTVAYFGAAPIPLIAHLGFLLSTWARVETYQQHHTEKHWRYLSNQRTSVEVIVSNEPSDINSSVGDVIVRVSASYAIDPADVKAVVDTHIADIGIDLEPLDKDNLASFEDLEYTARAVVTAIERLVQKRPSAERVHLFYSGPTGLIFRITSALNHTVVPRIAVYQYDRKGSPRYTHAFDLQDDAGHQPALTDEQRALATEVRTAWTAEFESIVTWAKILGRSPSQGGWLARSGLPAVSPEVVPQALFDLPCIGDGRFKDSCLGDVPQADDGFAYDRDTKTWRVDDSLLYSVGKRIPKGGWARAARLFFLHEALHIDAQNVTGALAFRIGVHHPVIAEDFDFRADGWAMMHELSYSWDRGASGDPAAWLRQSIELNNEIIWAFIPEHEAMKRLELRRVRRLTNWYWQYLRLREVSTLDSAVKVLLDKPSISLSGPPIHSAAGRTYVLLGRFELEPEAAVLIGNRLRRVGSSDSMDLRAAFEGLRTLDARPLRRALEGLLDTLSGH